MEDKKALEVVRIYRKVFELFGIPNLKHPHHKLVYYCNAKQVLSHCYSMLEGVEEFISDGKHEERDRALVRLGFVQGCLWTEGYFTVEELKNHNRPDVGTFSPQTHEPLTKEDLEDWEY